MKDNSGIVAPSQAERSLADLAAAINAAHVGCEAALKAGLAHALDAGRMLNEAKQRIGHGNWLPWVKANLPFSERTARNYMRLDRERDRLGKSATVADLGYREAVALLMTPAEPGMSDEELREAAERVRSTVRDAISHWRQMGEWLAEVKALLTPEQWTSWLSAEVSLSSCEVNACLRLHESPPDMDPCDAWNLFEQHLDACEA